MITKFNINQIKFILIGLFLAGVLKLHNYFYPEFHIGWILLILFGCTIQYLANTLAVYKLKIATFKDLVFCPRCKKVDKYGQQFELETIISDNIIDMDMKLCSKCAVYYSKIEASADAFITNLKNFINKETLQRLQLNIMPIGCITWDLDFKVTSWNPAATQIFGFTEEEAIGKHAFDIIVPLDAQKEVTDIWNRLLKVDITAHSENNNITKDGNHIRCYWTNTPMKRTEDNSLFGVLSMVQLVTNFTKK
jgi:PAS domain S-box-containing protein